MSDTLRVVALHFTGPVRKPPGLGPNTRVVVPATDPTIAGLLADLGYGADDLVRLRALVDGSPAGLDRTLFGGETVTVFLPVGGG